MKLKKLIALLLAVIMIVTAPVALVSAEGEKSAEEASSGDFNTRYTVDSAFLNTRGSLLEYREVNDDVRCTHGFTATHQYIQINSGGANSTTGFRSLELVMKEGDKLKFDYWYSTELNYDWFNFTAHRRNGDDILSEHISGSTPGADIWFTHTFTAPSTDWYSFTWEYVKDGSTNVGDDCVRISGVYLYEHWDYQRANYMTKPGTGLFEYDFFNNAQHGFTAEYDSNYGNNSSFIRSGNAGEANSISQVKLSARTRACTLKFNYSVDCEEPNGSNYYDYFEVTVDGTSILKAAGNQWNWVPFSHELSAGWHDIVFKYVKDNSVNSGHDCADIANVELVYPSNDAIPRWQEINRLGSASKKVYFNTPNGSAGWGVKDDNASNVRGYSNNRYILNSESYCETMITMQQGETLSFDYVISSQPQSDRWANNLIFDIKNSSGGSVNGGLVVNGWIDRYWHSHTFTAPNTDTYTFTWKYFKDDSSSVGWDYAYIRNVNYSGNYNTSLNLDDVLTTNDSAPIHFVTDMTNGLGFQACAVPGQGKDHAGYGAVSRNKYMENTTATIEGQAGELSAGDYIFFNYLVSSEASYDNLVFKVKKNGSVVHTMTIDGTPEGNHRYYEYNIPSNGNYTFVWEYQKDSSANRGTDSALIYGIALYKYEPTYDLDLINSDETQQQLNFSTGGEYPFECRRESNGTYYAVSTNDGVHSSVSYMQSTASLTANTELEFYYYLSSEQNYDMFKFFVNGQQVYSNSGDAGILLYRWTAPSAGSYTFRWEYVKDNSTNTGDDCVKIMEVKVRSGGSSGTPGDTDGNGTVNMVDAILVLRHAMGITLLSADQQPRADIDGNGSVNMSDAVMILRRSMGIS